MAKYFKIIAAAVLLACLLYYGYKISADPLPPNYLSVSGSVSGV